MAKYSKKAQDKVEQVMREKKRGTLKSGRSGKKVTSRKQAIAIGLSEAREAGAKVPPKKAAKKTARKKSATKKSATKRSAARKRTTTPRKKTGTRTSGAAKKKAAKKKSR